MFYILLQLPETPVNNFNNHILFFRRHLVIAGQTQSPLENICTNIYGTGFFYIRIAPCPAVAVPRYKRIHAVYGLRVHRFPDRTAFCIEGSNRIQNFRRAAFTRFTYI